MIYEVIITLLSILVICLFVVSKSIKYIYILVNGAFRMIPSKYRNDHLNATWKIFVNYL